MDRESVLEAMNAPGILRYVAADGARDLARWVGRVIKAVRRRHFGNDGVPYARLHDGDTRSRINAHYAHELRHGEEHAIAGRQGAAREAGARPAGHYGYVEISAGSEDALYLLFGLGQRDHHRHLAIGRQAVAFVGPRVFLFVEH